MGAKIQKYLPLPIHLVFPDIKLKCQGDLLDIKDQSMTSLMSISGLLLSSKYPWYLGLTLRKTIINPQLLTVSQKGKKNPCQKNS